MSSKDKGSITVLCLAFGILLLLTAVPLSPGQFYVLKDVIRNYSAAVLKCRSLGYDGLAVMESKEKFQIVLKMIKDNTESDYWIGMHYSDNRKHHVWDTGADVTFADWQRGEPDDVYRDKCVHFKYKTQYVTWTCSWECMAICGNYSSVFHDMTVRDGQQVIFTDPLWSGKASSLFVCVTLCTNDPRCQHSFYNSSDRTCVTLSKNYDVAGSVKQTMHGTLASKVEVTLV